MVPYRLPSWRLKKGEEISIGMIAWNELWVPHFKVFKKSNIFYQSIYNQFFEAFFEENLNILAKSLKHRKKFTSQNVYIGFLYSSMQLTIGDIYNIIEKKLLMILIKIT